MIKVYCYSKCSTCKKALKFLNDNNINYELKDIITEHPEKDEMKDIINRSGLDSKRFFNTSGNLYKELKLKEVLINMDLDSKISLLVSNGMLIKRPLIVGENTILTGFKESEWQENIINKFQK